MPVLSLPKRQACSTNPYDECFGNSYDSWWWSPTGMAARYAIVAAFFVLIAAFLIIGYTHGMRRLRRGQEPLAYHRWMVRRHQYRMNNPSPHNHFAFYRNGPGYPMTGYGGGARGDAVWRPSDQAQTAWQQPPPAYHASESDVPPTYQPPVGGSKVNPDQGGTNARVDGSRHGGEGSSGVSAPPRTHAAVGLGAR
ncbi:hypothetical protein LTR50_002496 [Elasticomyces elasticus]|nr:hypothetical protein LTR50_002496 [Elasticomyces elasticus]